MGANGAPEDESPLTADSTARSRAIASAKRVLDEAVEVLGRELSSFHEQRRKDSMALWEQTLEMEAALNELDGGGDDVIKYALQFAEEHGDVGEYVGECW